MTRMIVLSNLSRTSAVKPESDRRASLLCFYDVFTQAIRK